MNAKIDHTNLHRTAKYFMDSGKAASPEDAIGFLQRFGLSIVAGPEAASSRAHQDSLLTLINLTSRTLLAGVEVLGIPTEVVCLSRLAQSKTLAEAIFEFGGRVASAATSGWPVALIGDAQSEVSPCWQVTWAGWRGGVTPGIQRIRLAEDDLLALSPILAASVCAAEVFAWHTDDHAMAGRRSHGLSLWRPGRAWLEPDPSETQINYLPSRLWMIGLGNLGQAFSWLIAALPYLHTSEVQLVLQDFDTLAPSNASTSLLTFERDVGRSKARVLAEWLDRRTFKTVIEERYFGSWTQRNHDEPAVALCGVDNALARAALEDAGFDLVVEVGLGAGPGAFRSFSMHTFPGPNSAREMWSVPAGDIHNPQTMPAYAHLKKMGIDECVLTQLASRTVGVPFVGLIAACLAISELLRRLNAGLGFAFISGSVLALQHVEGATLDHTGYDHGHTETEQRSGTHSNQE